MPSADKRARQKENARAAREQREAALKKSKRNRSIMTFGIIAALFVGLIVILSVTGGDKKKDKAASSATTPSTAPPTTAFKVPAGCDLTRPPKEKAQTFKEAPPMTIDTAKTYVAHVSTSCGDFDITLDAKDAPKTANSFVFLANKKFFDGLNFHRLVPDFVIQGGDPAGDGTGGPGYELPTEPPKNGYTKGSVAMANAGEGTTGSQFFVTVSDAGAKNLGGPPYLYSSLGTVTKGMDVVDKLMKFAPADDGAPVKPLYIKTVTISES